MTLTRQKLFAFLEEKYHQYNNSQFIETDPVSIPHQFSRKEDIEISGFLTATISWGNRVSILKDANQLMERMDHSPYTYISEGTSADFKSFRNFYHRTFNGEDCIFFITALRNVYRNHGGLENCFSTGKNQKIYDAIVNFRKIFLETDHSKRSEKHLSSPSGGSACKRINMFLRWMVRKDERGVDLGIWKNINPADLCCPLDVHTGNVARKLGLVKGNQNNWKAVEELTRNLRSFDPADPVKYDFALFGLGIFEKF